ncbi:helix-turn-helix domain-containing protein [Dyadobacter fanqingshengii]|uniref:AraC family transcriptional regulator n=1 Tax=Dyadobacter fanqingshengii TaxID=2906443 RepID=A0A9X1TAL5_9BACT|nr:AraC family transcriptional regulator [Dyadobacter fanqingshengii]MCF0041014.1 AraC family transcriptional regulator [Dyadobacter fanqingshengii]USJ37255.1 AraC family transcriptional regulator [Dyadobacter fanqingshengii]
MEEKQSREFEKGSMTGVVWQCDGIRIGHAISKFTELSSFSSSSKTDVVRMHFGMRGNYSFDYKQLNKTFDLIGGHHNIVYSHDFDMVVNNKTLELETFGIQFPKDLFIRFTEHSSESLRAFCENIIAGRSAILSDKWGTIDSPIQQVIQQIIHCRYADDLKKLFLLSKSIELLVLCADAASTSKTKKEIFIKNATDKEKIIAVRDLINDRVHCPPNLSEIAQYVGLNEYKLKRGFKETFNSTVFGYLTDQRLNLARQYLLDTQKTAAEIASQLGYATPQHFNNAFKKKFGITPYLVRNNP